MTDIEYVHVGTHADTLQSGLGIGPGERVTQSQLDKDGGDDHLTEGGTLVRVDSFDTGPRNIPVAVEQPTRSDLLSRAGELNVEGRSKMTVDELRNAIATAETQGEVN